MKKDNFNPKKVCQYFGTKVKTKGEAVYGLDSKGKFKGRESIDESKVMLIAGIKEEYFYDTARCLISSEPKAKQKLDDLICKYGEEIRPGLHLVVSFKPKYVKQKNKKGFISLL